MDQPRGARELLDEEYGTPLGGGGVFCPIGILLGDSIMIPDCIMITDSSAGDETASVR